jgi:hypothetical protein
MAVRINLKKTDKPVAKFDAVFSGDRTQALANMETAPAAALTSATVSGEDTGAPVQNLAGGATGAGGGTDGSAAPAAAAPDMAASAVALRMVHAEVATQQPEAAPVEEEASEAILKPSGKPAAIRAFSIFLKWGLIGGVLLGGGYYAMRHVFFPVAQELQKAKAPGPVVVDKTASPLVQVVQQARVTVAKNDAKVDYLNQIIEATPEPPKPVVVEAPPPKPVVRTPVAKDTSVYREAIDALKISAVLDGDPPRLFIDNIIVKPGAVVNRPLGLSFAGIDTVERVLYFTNKDNEIFRKAY